MRYLIELWPAVIPLLAYFTWLVAARRKFRDGPWYWAVFASFAVGIICLLALGLSNEKVAGHYAPPELIDGKVVPGRIDR